MASFTNREILRQTLEYIEQGIRDAKAQQQSSWAPFWSCPDPSSSQPLCPPGYSADEYHSNMPQGPPPGLCRAFPPRPAPIHRLTDSDVSLFGDFAEYLDTGFDEDGLPVEIDISCCICMESKLRVPECVTSADATGSTETLVVFPCGHFFGGTCYQRYRDSCYSSLSLPITCPLCRFNLTYDDCEHDVLPRYYDPEQARNEQMPLTLPEGGTIPYHCKLCNEGRVQRATWKLRRLLFPPTVAEGDLRYVNSDEILRQIENDFRNRSVEYLSIKDLWNSW
ncbi:hypothetical protein F4777DRAFT_566221 [Nemania sp. FL0916]|nr:hypothetical protein F4777DRAFT_566221 [Nemania sp. FL0916]